MGPAHLLLLSCFACDSAVSDSADPRPADSADTGADDTADTSETGDSVPDTADSGDSTDTDTGPLPTDADGDGAWTPDDCDDDDAGVYPGAEDPCDDIDQDCDGVTWSPGSCGEVRGWAEVVRWVEHDGAYAVLPVGDLTGDGLDDFLVPIYDHVFARPDGTLTDGAALYPGGSGRPSSLHAPDDAIGCIWEPYSVPRPAGDMNADGFDDLIDAAIFDGYYGVIYGPLPTDGTCADPSTRYDAAFEAYWWGEPGVSEDWTASGDLDDDGIPDFAVEEFGDAAEYGYTTALVDVFRGGEFGLPRARILSADGVSATPEIVEDIDGDGIDDLALSEDWGDSTAWVISGPEAMAADEMVGSDLAFLTLDSGDAEIIGYWGGPRTAGDWTGDGLADLLVEDPVGASLGYQHGEILVLDGSVHGRVTLDDAVGSWVGQVEGGGLIWRNTGDFDGDGEDELLVGTVDANLIVDHHLPALREPVSGLPLDTRALFQSPTGDVDGDGRDDLPVRLIDDGTLGLWYGWDIPFDDPAAW